MADSNLPDISRYKKDYSGPRFWGKIRSTAKKAGIKVIYLALILYYVLMSESTNAKNRSIIIGALGYFILPIDILPDTIPALGYTDDFALLVAVFFAVKNSVTPEIQEKARKKLDQWFDGYSEEDVRLPER
ncbi:MAG: DUF1232 domain-containing protein [Bacteroidales bacterium]|nr:DUF1232 domain-containing protein [Bacteroidales bacterium]